MFHQTGTYMQFNEMWALHKCTRGMSWETTNAGNFPNDDVYPPLSSPGSS